MKAATVQSLPSLSNSRILQPTPEVLGYLSGRQVGLSTGMRRLDEKLRGLQGLVCVMGEPKVNKSTLVLQWLLHHAEGGGIAHLLDLENGEALTIQRVLCNLMGMSTNKFKGVTDEQKIEWLNHFNTTRSFRYTDKALTPELYTEDIERLLNSTDRHVFSMIDSIQWLRSKQAEKRLRIEEWVSMLDELKLRYRNRLTIVCVSEKNRPSYRAATAASPKDSGAIEYKAEQLFDLQHGEDDEDGMVKLTCVANRHGPKGWSLNLEPVMAVKGDEHSFTFRMQEVNTF